MKIPKIIHQIWIGNKPIPEKAMVYRKKIIELHPDWTHMLWTDDSVIRSGMSLNKTYYLSENTGHRSDILRYQIMHEYGGIYLDMDIDIQKNLNNLTVYEAFVGRNAQFNIDVLPEEYVQNAVLGSCPKNLFFSFLLNQLPLWCISKKRQERLKTPWKKEDCVTVKTGPIFFSIMILRYKEVFGIDPPITILPSDYFYPYSGFSKEEDRQYPESYGIHRWWGTWAK